MGDGRGEGGPEGQQGIRGVRGIGASRGVGASGGQPAGGVGSVRGHWGLLMKNSVYSKVLLKRQDSILQTIEHELR